MTVINYEEGQLFKILAATSTGKKITLTITVEFQHFQSSR